MSFATQTLLARLREGQVEGGRRVVHGTSIGPSASSVWVTIASRPDGSARSATIGTAVPPSPSISFAVCWRLPSGVVLVEVRAVIATLAPSAPKRFAIAAPIPRLAPVTSATRPSSCPCLPPELLGLADERREPRNDGFRFAHRLVDDLLADRMSSIAGP